jgi:hypothetical protein
MQPAYDTMPPVKSKSLVALAMLFLVSCSGLTTLTRQMIDDADKKWTASKPSSYRLKVVMSGDRLERGEYDVKVENGIVVSFSRNGQELKAAAGQEYSMDGLFGVVKQEFVLSEEPSKLGAPEGYKAYLMAQFDDATGGLVKYRRSVGGVSNSIDIVVEKYEPLSKAGS